MSYCMQRPLEQMSVICIVIFFKKKKAQGVSVVLLFGQSKPQASIIVLLILAFG